MLVIWLIAQSQKVGIVHDNHFETNLAVGSCLKAYPNIDLITASTEILGKLLAEHPRQRAPIFVAMFLNFLESSQTSFGCRLINLKSKLRISSPPIIKSCWIDAGSQARQVVWSASLD